jgi:catechol 2,3-dioxygenase-like lactoylglutathione lyase family enzyme
MASLSDILPCAANPRPSAKFADHLVHLQARRLLDKIEAKPRLSSVEITMKLSRIIPMLPVKHVPASIDFYKKLGFQVQQSNDGWGWAMLRFDDCRVMLDQSINLHPGTPRASVLYLYPDNVVDYHREVRASGIDVPDLDVTFYGMTEFRLDDPDGNRLWIGQSTSQSK